MLLAVNILFFLCLQAILTWLSRCLALFRLRDTFPETSLSGYGCHKYLFPTLPFYISPAEALTCGSIRDPHLLHGIVSSNISLLANTTKTRSQRR